MSGSSLAAVGEEGLGRGGEWGGGDGGPRGCWSWEDPRCVRPVQPVGGAPRWWRARPRAPPAAAAAAPPRPDCPRAAQVLALATASGPQASFQSGSVEAVAL